MEKIVAILIAAHFMGDFFLQPKKMVRNKQLPLMLNSRERLGKSLKQGFNVLGLIHDRSEG